MLSVSPPGDEPIRGTLSNNVKTFVDDLKKTDLQTADLLISGSNFHLLNPDLMITFLPHFSPNVPVIKVCVFSASRVDHA